MPQQYRKKTRTVSIEQSIRKDRLRNIQLTESSSLNISAGEESSVHASDFSSSASEISSFNSKGPNLKRKYPNSTSRKEHEPEVVLPSRFTKNRPVKNDSIACSTGSSSGGSPWMDDSGSSSGYSSQSATSIDFTSTHEKYLIEMARLRLKAAPKRSQSVPTQRLPRTQSPSSVCTGKNASKPIDVTGAPHIAIYLENKSYKQREKVGHDGRKKSKISIEMLNPKIELPKARIVGLVPARVNTKDSIRKKPNNSHLSVKRPVPPLVIPAFCSQEDDVSSLGVTRLSVSHQSKLKNYRWDVEYGMENKLDSDTPGFGVWMENRTGLEICLIFLVSMSLVALAILITFIIIGH